MKPDNQKPAVHIGVAQNSPEQPYLGLRGFLKIQLRAFDATVD